MAEALAFAPLFKGMGLLSDRVTSTISRLLKREVLRRVPSEIQNVLARMKLEILVWEGTPYASTTIIDPIDLTHPNIKILSYVKRCDHTPVGGVIQTDIITFGVEDLTDTILKDDWKDLIVSARIAYNAEGTAPESIWVTVTGSYTHARIYVDGVLDYESVKVLGGKPEAERYYTYYFRAFPLT